MMINNKQKQHTGGRAGVTLVEFLVAFGIFVFLITLASGSFVRSVRIQRAALQLMAVNDNMGITIEQMMREMRTGYNFCTSGTVLSGATSSVNAQCASLGAGEIQFVTAGNVVTRYRLKSGGTAIQKGIVQLNWDLGSPAVGCDDGEFDSTNGVCYRNITADNVKVTKAQFIPLYSDAGDKRPPRITVSFEITSSDPLVQSLTSPMTIQTTVSARCGELSCPSDS